MNRQPAIKTGSAQPGVVDLRERNWLPRHHRGDPKAFGELLSAYRTLVMTLLFRHGVETAHRDDLFQEVFLKIHTAAGRYRPGEPLRPWLVSIVLNTVRNHRRASGRRRHAMNQWQLQPGTTDLEDATSNSGMSSGHVAHAPGPDEQVDRATTLSWLEQQITQLPVTQRDVLVLSTVKGLRMREIAKMLRLPENTVKTHLRRARLALAERLAERNAPAIAAGGDRS